MPNRWFRRKLDEFELFAIDVIYGRREGLAAAVFGAFLQLCSHLFSGIVQARFWLYRNRIFHDQPLGCLVVVVGNLTVGGTGKTPVVEKFARALHDKGRKVAILSRGYKSKAPPLWKKWWFWLTHTEPEPPRVVSDGERVLLDSEVAGDEPYMLARNLPGVVVLVDKDRVKAGAYAIKRFGCDTLVLDDGFQYLPLKGRLNLLLVDTTNPFGNGHLLPRGILREPVKHLRRASYVFLTKSNGQRDEELEQMIQRFHPGVDMIECAHRPRYLQRLDGDAPFRSAQSAAPAASRLEVGSLAGKKISAFSGIAAPDSFEGFLRSAGAKLVHTRRFLDHHRFSVDDLLEIADEAKAAGAEMIVTTEKDAVRIPAGQSFPLPVFYLRLEIEIVRGAADFAEAVDKVCRPAGSWVTG